jgi:SNF2 family DNA or RNA helicase
MDLVPKSVALKMEESKRTAKAWTPWPYQERALKALLENGQYGLLLQPGLGKTSVTLAAVKILLAKKLVKRVLVIAPLRPAYEVWPVEVADWKDFNAFGVALLHGLAKDKVLRSLQLEHQVVIINPEGLNWLFKDKKRAKLLGADMLVIDESSLFKSGTSVRFRRLRSVLGQFKRRVILTGSPRPKNYEDLWAQVYLLDQGASLGNYITHYRNQYFFPTGFQMREWSLLPGADETINKKIAPLVLRMDAEDYLKLPKLTDQTHFIELPPKARELYEQVESGLMSTLFTAPMVNSTAARSRCAQIANGSVYLDPTDPDDIESWKSSRRPVQVVHTAKVEALMELVGELQGEPLLCSIGYHHDVTAIRVAAGKDTPCINGATTRTQLSDYITRWNKGLLPLLMIHPAAAGHGLNMQKCNGRHIAIFDLPDNYDTYFQMFQRVWRQGNKADFCIRHHFVVRNTVDVAKLRNLRKKGDGQKAFLDAMKQYAEEKGLKINAPKPRKAV